MKIFTSYFNRVKTINDDRFVYVAITRGKVPNWFPHNHTYLNNVAPSFHLVSMWKNGLCTWEQYCQWYDIEIDLDRNKDIILYKLKQISEDNGDRIPVLLCHCSDYEHCHRKLVGEAIGAKELINADIYNY